MTVNRFEKNNIISLLLLSSYILLQVTTRTSISPILLIVIYRYFKLVLFSTNNLLKYNRSLDILMCVFELNEYVIVEGIVLDC